MNIASIKNPLGAIIIIVHFTKVSGMICIPKKVPNPSNSLTNAIESNTNIYPSPEVKPSQKEIIGLFDCAKASALPMIMQLVMINPTYGPKALLISGK